MTATSVYLEVGEKRTFACALEWPGWSRSGQTDQDALEALAAYALRYQPVVAEAGLDWPGPVADEFRVVERLPGTMSTDFGAPGEIPAADRQPLSAASRERAAALVGAAWAVFDATVAKTPAQLRKGPRGGGRDRDKMVDHVLAAEASYARKIGVKHAVPQRGDGEAIAALRKDILAALIDPRASTAWPTSYAARRIAWHVLDHAWEMEDKSEPPPAS
jgi:hypothetical protein